MNKITPINVITVITVLLAGLFSGGCASIVHSGNRSISINTEPVGAKATISKQDGEVVTVQTTPCTVSLDPKKRYFVGQPYVLRLELAGYKSTQVELKPTMSGWYFGNIIFGGLIGMVAVDPVTGSMWNIEPSKIQQKLTAEQATLIKNKHGFVVVLVSDLTAGERSGMQKIN